jgi:hypothetical protein
MFFKNVVYVACATIFASCDDDDDDADEYFIQ